MEKDFLDEKYKKERERDAEHIAYPNNATVNAILSQPPSHTDIQGSYTGKPFYDEDSRPIQDVDDL